MAQYNYSSKEYTKDHMARTVGRNLHMSTKQAILIANLIRNKSLSKARQLLIKVTQLKIAVPATRFNFDTGHKKGGIGPGRYYVKASKMILQLLDNVENNAQVNGLNTGELFIAKIIPQKGSTQYHQGRKGGKEMKKTHVEIVVKERAKKDTKKETSKK